MLASHLSPAGRTIVLPQLYLSKTVTSAAVLRSANLGRSSWCHQQTRGIKIEFWPRYLHSDLQRDQGHHRVSKSAYIESLNRKLLRHRHLRMHVSHSTIKSFMCSAFRHGKSGINSKKLKPNAAHTTSTHSQTASGTISSRHKATLNGRSSGTFDNDGSQFHLKYDIDPITNRKVPRRDSSSKIETQGDSLTNNIPVKKFDGYKTPVSQSPDPKRKSSYITDSELYRDGRTVKEELGIYKPFQHNEPDGHLPPPPDPVEQALNDGRTFAEELDTYKPFRHNEPDGHLPSKLDFAGSSLVDGQKLEEELRTYKPFQHNEPDGHFPPPSDPVEEALNEYDQKRDPKFNGYSAFRYNEPDGHFPLPPDPVEEALNEYDQKRDPKFEGYGAFRYNEPDGHLPLPPDPVKSSLDKYDQKQDPKIDGYSAFRYNEPDGHVPPPPDPVKSALDKYDQKWEPKLENDNFVFDEDFDDFKTEQSVKPISSTPVVNHTSESFPSQLSSEKEKSQNQRPVTGNFVQDFPEEYAVTWKSDGVSLLPKHDETVAKPPSKARAIDSSEFSSNPATPRLQTSLERSQGAFKDTHSKSSITEPVGFQDTNINEDTKKTKSGPPLYVSSYGTNLPRATKTAQNTDATESNDNDKNRHMSEKALTNELRRINEDAYGAIGSLHRQPVDQPSSKGGISVDKLTGDGSPIIAPDPTFYKILAYSPDTQSILTSETTSIVPPDNQKPLSPATVLLRLSKPAKFLPHIAPLLREGYEIVSGNGLVLVFRKVRDGPPPGLPVAKAEPDIPLRKMTNPIDGMQSIRPATGNFASPTGFVNHDLPEYHSEPLDYGIDAGRDEHIYGGSRANWQDQEWEGREAQRGKGKKRVKRVLVGAVWVGGLSYAVGVVAEYFRTGGADGNGPVGL